MGSSKLIIVDKDDVRMMTFEEIMVRYHSLVMKIIWNFDNLKIDLDDKKQIANIGLWQAYSNYDVSTGTAFWALAKISVTNCLRVEFRYNRRSKRNGVGNISLYQPVDSGTSDGHLVIDEIVDYDSIEDDLIAKNHLKVFMNAITDKQKETLILVGMGKSYAEIAELTGQSRPTISMRMTATRKIFNECMNIPKKPNKRGPKTNENR